MTHSFPTRRSSDLENPERGPVKMVRHYSAAMASCFSLRRSRDTLDLKTERRSLLNVLLLTSITRTRCALPDESRTVRVVTSDAPLSLIFAIRNLALQDRKSTRLNSSH